MLRGIPGLHVIEHGTRGELLDVPLELEGAAALADEEQRGLAPARDGSPGSF